MEQVWNVLLGGALAVAAQWANSYFQDRREHKKWQREQESEKVKGERESRRNAERQLAEIYSECVYLLALYCQEHTLATRGGAQADDAAVAQRNEALRWVTRLVVHFPAEARDLGTNLQFFLSHPSFDKAHKLKVAILADTKYNEQPAIAG